MGFGVDSAGLYVVTTVDEPVRDGGDLFGELMEDLGTEMAFGARVILVKVDPKHLCSAKRDRNETRDGMGKRRKKPGGGREREKKVRMGLNWRGGRRASVREKGGWREREYDECALEVVVKACVHVRAQRQKVQNAQ